MAAHSWSERIKISIETEKGEELSQAIYALQALGLKAATIHLGVQDVPEMPRLEQAPRIPQNGKK